VPPDVRAAGALVLLYGLPVTRIHRLSTEGILHIGDNSFLDLDQHPVLLPPPLTQMPRTSARRPRRTKATAPQHFLLPGSRAIDAPIAACTLTARLNPNTAPALGCAELASSGVSHSDQFVGGGAVFRDRDPVRCR
jgi:hypothetical protein